MELEYNNFIMRELLNILNENKHDNSVYFVFPSDISASMWAEKLLEFTGSGTVPMERFHHQD